MTPPPDPSPAASPSTQTGWCSEFRREVRDKLFVVFNGCNSTPLDRQVAIRQCEEFLVEMHETELAAARQGPPAASPGLQVEISDANNHWNKLALEESQRQREAAASPDELIERTYTQAREHAERLRKDERVTADDLAIQHSPAASPGVDPLREQLAALAHEQWTGWMRYLFGKCKYPDSGGVRMPAEWAERWMLQMNTPYPELSEAEKESDRKEADRVLSLLAAERQQHTAQIAELAQDVTFLEGQVEASALGLMSFRAEVASLTQQLELQQRFTRSAEQSFLTTKEQLTEAQIALDEIGALRADAMGELTITGRCWALSQRWAEEQANLQTQIATLREALRRVRAHTAWQRPADGSVEALLSGLLQSIERITDQALAAPRTGEQP